MRHGKKFNHLGRKSQHRRAMLSNMACSLIQHKRIHTTLAKAKALRCFVEPIITKSKNDYTHSRRLVFSILRNKYAVTSLFRDVAKKIGDRPGGYTRIIKLGNRKGDNAEIAMIELVDYNETYVRGGEAKKIRRSRSRSKSKKETIIDTTADTVGATDGESDSKGQAQADGVKSNTPPILKDSADSPSVAS